MIMRSSRNRYRFELLYKKNSSQASCLHPSIDSYTHSFIHTSKRPASHSFVPFIHRFIVSVVLNSSSSFCGLLYRGTRRSAANTDVADRVDNVLVSAFDFLRLFVLVSVFFHITPFIIRLFVGGLEWNRRRIVAAARAAWACCMKAFVCIDLHL